MRWWHSVTVLALHLKCRGVACVARNCIAEHALSVEIEKMLSLRLVFPIPQITYPT